MRRPKSIALALALVASVSSFCLADTQPNPYLSVVDRNPFGLKPSSGQEMTHLCDGHLSVVPHKRVLGVEVRPVLDKR